MNDLPVIQPPPVTKETADVFLASYPGLKELLSEGWVENLGDTSKCKHDSLVARVLAKEIDKLKERSAAESDALVESAVAVASRLSDNIALHKVSALICKAFDITKPVLNAAIRKLIAENGVPGRTHKVTHAITDIYYDSQHNYFRRIESEGWDAMATEQAKRHLKVECRLTDILGENDDFTEIDEALHRIETQHRVTAALPFPLWEDTVVAWGSDRFLNTAQVKLMAPDNTKSGKWGDGFPWISDYLDGLFFDQNNKDAFLGWLRSWYCRVRDNKGDGGRGQAVFLVGPTGTGKTLLSHWVVGPIFGGYSDVSKMFTENAGFNDAAFKTAVWCVDDAKSLGSRETHTRFSSEVKRVVANPDYDYDKKYGYRGSVPFCGRFMCSLNPGPIAIQLLPDTDLDLLDKVNLLRTTDRACPKPDQEKIKAELPAFLKWLVTSTAPAWLTEGNPRFGVNSFHDASILEEAREASLTYSYLELVDIWRIKYGMNPNVDDGLVSKDKKSWTGLASNLVAELYKFDGLKGAIPRGLTPSSIGKHLKTAIDMKNAPWATTKRTKAGVSYTIQLT